MQSNARYIMPGWAVGILLALMMAPAVWAQRAVPPLTGRVVDTAEILTAAEEAQIDTLLAAHEAATSNQVAVLTIPSLDGEVLEAYSLRVARTWALGTAENDNGVLLLVALADRKMRIEVGFGLEGALTDAQASRILRNELRPRFQEGRFGDGVIAGCRAIVGTLEGTYTPPASSATERPPFWFGLLFLLLPSLFAFFGVFTFGCFRWFLFLFLVPFFFASGMMLTGSVYGGGALVVVYAVAFILAIRHPKIQAAAKDLKEKGRAKVGPFTMSSGGSGGGSSWSSGGSSFSGGGGSFGGGGASGGW